MRTANLAPAFDDIDGIAHPGPSPFGHISELGPIRHDRPGWWRPREIDQLGPIRLRPVDGPRLSWERRGVPDPVPRQQWEPEGPVEL